MMATAREMPGIAPLHHQVARRIKKLQLHLSSARGIIQPLPLLMMRNGKLADAGNSRDITTNP
jgi:hypothetical protein